MQIQSCAFLHTFSISAQFLLYCIEHSLSYLYVFNMYGQFNVSCDVLPGGHSGIEGIGHGWLQLDLGHHKPADMAGFRVCWVKKHMLGSPSQIKSRWLSYLPSP